MNLVVFIILLLNEHAYVPCILGFGISTKKYKDEDNSILFFKGT